MCKIVDTPVIMHDFFFAVAKIGFNTADEVPSEVSQNQRTWGEGLIGSVGSHTGALKVLVPKAGCSMPPHLRVLHVAGEVLRLRCGPGCPALSAFACWSCLVKRQL